MNTKRRIPFTPLVALALALLAGGVLVLRARAPAEGPPLAGSGVGGPFSLVDQNGRVRTDRYFAGSYRLIYFGYSFCPDICPTDLQRNAAALRLFERRDAARAARITPIFVSVDPARDTPAQIKPYVEAFHPRMVGLTGSEEAVARAKSSYRVYAERSASAGAAEYLMDHSSITYLMGPAGEPITMAASTDSAAALAEQLDRYVG